MAGSSKPRQTFFQWLDNNAMTGLTPKSLKHHYSIWPMHFSIVAGVLLCIGFSIRTLVFNPDSTLLGRDAYERYRDGKYFKFFNISGVILDCKAPVYRREGDPDDDSYALPEF